LAAGSVFLAGERWQRPTDLQILWAGIQIFVRFSALLSYKLFNFYDLLVHFPEKYGA
jgi:hypothetical protein